MSRIEKISDNVICLSDIMPVDGRVSWLPPKARGFESYNKNLVLSSDCVLLIETGVACHGTSLVESMKDVLSTRPLVIFPTRIELDSIGNLARLYGAFPQTALVSANPIPANRLVHLPNGTTPAIPFTPVTPGQTLAAVGFPNVLVVDPIIRTLGTAWLFDEISGTLFTGDFFCDDLLASADMPTIRRDGQPFFAPEGLRASILQKFDWLENASTTLLAAAWDALFGRIRPKAIAGVRGRVCAGEANVQELLAFYHEALFPDQSITDASVNRLANAK